MIEWMSQLKPEMQLLLLSNLIMAVFGAGSWFSTIKALRVRVMVHDETLVKHTAKLAVLDERTKEL